MVYSRKKGFLFSFLAERGGQAESSCRSTLKYEEVQKLVYVERYMYLNSSTKAQNCVSWCFFSCVFRGTGRKRPAFSNVFTTIVLQAIGEQGGVRGCRPPPVLIFMTPPLKFKSTPPPREGLFDPLAGFWIFDRGRFFFRLEIFFENLTSKKIFRRLPTAKFFFSEIAKSCDYSVKIGDFLKFATPPEIFLWPP